MSVVIVSNAIDSKLAVMTQQTILSCRNSGEVNWDIIVVEQQKKTAGYYEARTITYEFPFNYNKCLNLGIKYAKYKYIALCNNDLEFTQGWGEEILALMKAKNYLSASPNYKPGHRVIKEGYKLRQNIMGWCIVVDRKIFDIIGKLDESLKFWYSDNLYALQLRQHGIKHAMIGTSVVRHLGSKTLNNVNLKNKRVYTRGQSKVFHQIAKNYVLR